MNGREISKFIIKLKEFITIIVEKAMKNRRRRNLSDMSENSEDYNRSKQHYFKIYHLTIISSISEMIYKSCSLLV